jgi:type II secretory pathway pseudopilin PulG
MATAILGIISSLLLVVIGIWKYFGRKNAEKRKQAEQARKDLDEANQSDDPGKFLDAFGRL